MTTMYTIGIIILSLAFLMSLYNILLMIERKNKIWLLPILVVIGVLLIIYAIRTPALDRYYDVENPHSYQDLFPDSYKEGFENGYNNGYIDGYKRAIKEAELVEITDTGYIISFNGEDNIYVCNITDIDDNN